MKPVTVLEFIRHHVWTLPRRHVDELAAEFPSVRFLSPASREEAERALPEAEVIFGWVVTPANLATARELRWIQITAAGVSTMLFPSLIESPIMVCNGRGLHADAMAEHTLGVMLAFTRKLHLARDAQHQRRWAQDEFASEPPSFGALAKTTLGLVGMGAVGKAIAWRAAALGMRVVAVRRHPASDPAPAHEQWPTDRLPDLLAEADWVVLAAPATAETRGLIGRAELERMKPGTILINLGRGALVDEPALIEALERGRLAGASLDVVAEEPLPAASPLWAMPNVILTPHISGLGPRYWERATEMFARNLHAWLEGRPLDNVIDKQRGY